MDQYEENDNWSGDEGNEENEYLGDDEENEENEDLSDAKNLNDDEENEKNVPTLKTLLQPYSSFPMIKYR